MTTRHSGLKARARSRTRCESESAASQSSSTSCKPFAAKRNNRRNIASSPYLERPDLVEIKAAVVNNKRVAEFSMNLNLKQQKSDDDPAKATAAKAAKKG